MQSEIVYDNSDHSASDSDMEELISVLSSTFTEFKFEIQEDNIVVMYDEAFNIDGNIKYVQGYVEGWFDGISNCHY